jgi:phosphoglycerate kinase
MKSLTEIDLKGKKVLVRCDFNVPMDSGGITDTARIDASLETIRYILDHNAAVILCSHLGRPKKPSPELSLKPVAEYLGKALEKEVPLAPGCVGDITLRMVHDLSPGDALLLENLRFHREEEANDAGFALTARPGERYLRKRCFRYGASSACLNGRRNRFPARPCSGVPDVG